MEYVSCIDGLLEASLSHEVLADEDKLCRHCNKGILAVWWCKDCSIGRAMCRGCIRYSHKENPFHQIKKWNGHFFRPAELWEVGTYLLVQHHSGDPLCNTLIAQEHFLECVEQRNDDAEQETLKSITAPALATAMAHSSDMAMEHSSATAMADSMATLTSHCIRTFIGTCLGNAKRCKYSS